MSLKEYKPGQAFSGVIGRTFDVSQPAWPMPNRARDGAPNVLFIILDDTGFGQLSCYGSPINTPNLDTLAADGLRYNNMHTTALCSPSRSCFMTGRNHHSNGMSCITEGFDGLSRRERQYSIRKRDALGNPVAERIQHLRCRQMAPDTNRTDLRGRPLRPLAARPLI